MISRKDFLKKGALSALTLPVLSPALISGKTSKTSTRKTRKDLQGAAKNVIFLVADGMSIGTLSMGNLMNQRQFDRTSHWIQLYNSERTYHRGLMDMAAADSFITDSSAAASSWGCGQRINNGGVNWSVNNEPLRPITHIFRDAGKATGLVTTTRITHATPAGFAAAAPSRNLEDEIAAQYFEAGIDLLMGGGDRHFNPDKRRDGRDLYGDFGKAGYTILKDKASMMADKTPRKVLGIFTDSHLPYTVDQNTVPQLRDNVPTLAEMTKSALDRLDQHPDGFILQVEGGRVDHAAHGNDPSGLVYDMIAFDDAIGVVFEYIENREDTLVIITTDHSNANPGVNGAGLTYTDAPMMFDQLQKFRHSNEWIQEQLPKEPTKQQVKEIIEQATRLQITDDEAKMLIDSMKGEFITPYRAERTPSAVLGAIQANYVSINWLGGVHTSDYVELAALGPGSETLTSFTRNTELFDIMVDVAGVRAYAEAS